MFMLLIECKVKKIANVYIIKRRRKEYIIDESVQKDEKYPL